MKLLLSLTAVIAAATAHSAQDQEEDYARTAELYQSAQELQQKNLYSSQPDTYSSKTTYSVEPQTLQYSIQPYVQSASNADVLTIQPQSYSSSGYTYDKPEQSYSQHATRPEDSYSYSQYTTQPEQSYSQYTTQPEQSYSQYTTQPEQSYSQYTTQPEQSYSQYTTQPEQSYSQYTSQPDQSYSYSAQPFSDYIQSYTSKPQIETVQGYSIKPVQSSSLLQSYTSNPEASGYSQSGYSQSYSTQPQVSTSYSQSYSKPHLLSGNSQHSAQAQKLYTSQPQLSSYTQAYVKPHSVSSLPQSYSTKSKTQTYSVPSKSTSQISIAKPHTSSNYQYPSRSSYTQSSKNKPRPFSNSLYTQPQQYSELPQSFKTPQQYSNHLNTYSGQRHATHLNYDRPSGEKSTAVLHQDLNIDEHNYRYSYETENGIKAEEQGQTVDGTRTSGAYSYTGDDGQVYTVSYTADENGFRAEGAHIPTSPPIPEAIARSIEQNAKDEANGVFDDGKYNHRSEQDYQQVESANLHVAGVHSSQTHRQPISVTDYRSSH